MSKVPSDKEVIFWGFLSKFQDMYYDEKEGVDIKTKYGDKLYKYYVDFGKEFWLINKKHINEQITKHLNYSDKYNVLKQRLNND